MSFSDLKMNFQAVLKVVQDGNSKIMLQGLERMRTATGFEQLEVFILNYFDSPLFHLREIDFILS